jgi:UDP-N-acetylglucosamine 2-epimerase (non-hydrolysing)
MTEAKPLRILLVAGARPNFVKIAPLMDRLADPENAGRVETLLVHTGQHYDEALSRLFFDQLKIPRPNISLDVGSAPHGKQTGEIMSRFEPVVEDWKPDVVLVVGDVNSTIACAVVAVKMGVKVAHVEAGLRSFDRTMPEEINRVLTDQISDWLFVSEASGVQNLMLEGISASKIHLVGNVMIDSLRKFLKVARTSAALWQYHLVPKGQPNSPPAPFALLTLHRPSNVDDPEKLRSLLEVMNQVGEQIAILFPAHPRTRDRIERAGLAGYVKTEWTYEQLYQEKGVYMSPPIGYLEFLHLMSEASFVMTDSGGIQEETTALGLPCLTLRENTERPSTLIQGTNTLVGTDPARILSEARQILAGLTKKGTFPELWDGKASDRIVNILLGTTPPPSAT